MLIVDIDFFKCINDEYGYYVGDIVLIKIVRILEDNLRESDVIVWWGGEEFFILLFLLKV